VLSTILHLQFRDPEVVKPAPKVKESHHSALSRAQDFCGGMPFLNDGAPEMRNGEPLV